MVESLEHTHLEVLTEAKGISPHMVSLYQEFHAFPELSTMEIDTANRIVAELENIGGYHIQTGVGGHGVVATLKGGYEGSTIAIRADMDALPILEKNDIPFISKNEGIMHACGHDAHMTMALGAARLLANKKDELHGTVKFIFQPAEENAPIGGAMSMVNDGVMDGVDAIFGLHVWPDKELPCGVFGFRTGELMASVDKFRITITGKGAHAAQPHQSVDVLVTGAQFINTVQTIVSRNINPLDPVVVTFGVFSAGTQYNVIPEVCNIEGTCRTYHLKTRDLIEKRMEEILKGTCDAMGATFELHYTRGYPAVNNDNDLTAYGKSMAESLFGKDKVQEIALPTMVSEDFSVYQTKAPGTFFFFGCNKEHVPLHRPDFIIDEDILWRGAALFTHMAREFSESFIPT